MSIKLIAFQSPSQSKHPTGVGNHVLGRMEPSDGLGRAGHRLPARFSFLSANFIGQRLRGVYTVWGEEIWAPQTRVFQERSPQDQFDGIVLLSTTLTPAQQTVQRRA